MTTGMILSLFVEGDAPFAPSYDASMSQLVRFPRVCTDFLDFNQSNLCLLIN